MRQILASTSHSDSSNQFEAPIHKQDPAERESKAISKSDHNPAMSTSSSVRGGSISTQSSSQPFVGEQRRSSIGKIMDKAKAKMSGSERLSNDEADFERARAKEAEKQRRKEEYERLGLGDKTKFGMPGAGGFNA